jgi:tRNA-Thr(GGU) m(6)t(6)A37 methyltransferase TsaA
MKIELQEIGVIHSPFKDLGNIPIQPSFSDAVGEIEVFKEFEKGLKNVEGFSHIILLYYFHKSGQVNLHTKPYLDDKVKGVFATRSPHRPNHIGLSIVKLLERNGNKLKVKGIDVLDSTPLLDIKPYVDKFDKREDFKIGWLADKLKVEK